MVYFFYDLNKKILMHFLIPIIAIIETFSVTIFGVFYRLTEKK